MNEYGTFVFDTKEPLDGCWCKTREEQVESYIFSKGYSKGYCDGYNQALNDVTDAAEKNKHGQNAHFSTLSEPEKGNQNII